MSDLQRPRSAATEELRTETENRHFPARVQGKIGRRRALRMLASAAGAAILNEGIAGEHRPKTLSLASMPG